MLFPREDVTSEAIGAFYRVYNRLGWGFAESVYVGALVVELLKCGLRVQREAPLHVTYDGVDIGSFRADLLVEGKLIIEVKADSAFTAGPERQLMNYLRCSDLEVGLLFVFGIKPRFKRVIHTRDHKAPSST